MVKRAEDAHQVALALRRVDAELVGRGEDEDEAGWVIGTRRDHAVLEERERVEEAATVGHQPGLVVVPVRVAGLQDHLRLAHRDEGDAHGEPDQHDGCEGDLVRRPPRAVRHRPLELPLTVLLLRAPPPDPRRGRSLALAASGDELTLTAGP